MITRLRRYSPFLLCALIAAVGGLIGGTTAVQGLEQRPYGPVDPPVLTGRADHVPSFANGTVLARHDGDGSAHCPLCSERDLGYRWAIIAAVNSPDQCPHDSWGFRRGCLDYVGGV